MALRYFVFIAGSLGSTAYAWFCGFLLCVTLTCFALPPNLCHYSKYSDNLLRSFESRKISLSSALWRWIQWGWATTFLQNYRDTVPQPTVSFSFWRISSIKSLFLPHFGTAAPPINIRSLSATDCITQFYSCLLWMEFCCHPNPHRRCAGRTFLPCRCGMINTSAFSVWKRLQSRQSQGQSILRWSPSHKHIYVFDVSKYDYTRSDSMTSFYWCCTRAHRILIAHSFNNRWSTQTKRNYCDGARVFVEKSSISF